MKTPKVSIITINFNDSKGLEKTILSVCSQTYKNFEHIIVDGGSKDQSKDIISKYKDGLSKWVSEPDNGIYDAQNKGIKLAKGEYCLFLNSGDFLSEDSTLEKVFRKIKYDFYKEEIYYGDIFVISKNGAINRLYQPKRMSLFHLFSDTIWHPSAFIPTSLFKELGAYSLEYKICSDYEFWMKANYNNIPFKYIDVSVSVFDLDGLSSKKENKKLIADERIKIQYKYSNLIKFLIYRMILTLIQFYKIVNISIKEFIKFKLLNKSN